MPTFYFEPFRAPLSLKCYTPSQAVKAVWSESASGAWSYLASWFWRITTLQFSFPSLSDLPQHLLSWSGLLKQSLAWPHISAVSFWLFPLISLSLVRQASAGLGLGDIPWPGLPLEHSWPLCTHEKDLRETRNMRASLFRWECLMFLWFLLQLSHVPQAFLLWWFKCEMLPVGSSCVWKLGPQLIVLVEPLRGTVLIEEVTGFTSFTVWTQFLFPVRSLPPSLPLLSSLPLPPNARLASWLLLPGLLHHDELHHLWNCKLTVYLSVMATEKWPVPLLANELLVNSLVWFSESGGEPSLAYSIVRDIFIIFPLPFPVFKSWDRQESKGSFLGKIWRKFWLISEEHELMLIPNYEMEPAR